MKISRHPLVGLLLVPFGHRTSSLELVSSGLATDQNSESVTPFEEIDGPAEVRTGRLFTWLIVPTREKGPLVLVGASRSDARAFSDEFNTAWRSAIRAHIDGQAETVSFLGQAIERLSAPRRYPSACLVQPFVDQAKALFKAIPATLPEAALPAERFRTITAIAEFHRNPSQARSSAIERFVEAELREMGSFFDKIESNPLTPEQRLAVVTDEDATLVLAGAGSGKTSVIVAKAAYLIERGIRKPDEILLMAFGKDAAAEMAERIEERCGAPVAARTFHALAYGIIAQVEGSAPALAPHASDEGAYIALLRDILMELAGKAGETAGLLLQWFAEFFWPYRSAWDFKTKHEYYAYIEQHELRTLQGEQVKSFEELEIANWLYLNGIAYEYEPDYEHSLPKTGRRNYTPDFRLTDSGVYIEHFGVRKGRGPDGTERLTTAPYVDREDYLAGMEWKRGVHAEHGTVLVETFSYERMEGRLTQALAEKLAPYVELSPLPADRVFDRLGEMGQIDSFTQTLGTFLKHYKGAGHTIEDCSERNDRLKLGARGSAFLKIFDPIFAEYKSRLGQRIDFEDMIVRATEHIESGRYRSPFRHLLVDEFQDISKGRADLLRALKAQHDDARIFAVGDDWQSIYRFTGSDLHLMRDFGKEFGGHFAGDDGVHRTVDLGRTFRSVDRIALPARSFVLKNPAQITKQVIPAGTSDVPAILVAWSGKGEGGDALDRALKAIAEQGPGGNRKPASVLLVGRYRHTRPTNLAALNKAHPDLSITFKTIHAAKGLEADHVIVLRADAGRLGLPSEIVDDPILNLVLPAPELYQHAEERRVFYVAMTRARKSVTILASRHRPSPFVTELLENPEYGVIEMGEASAPAHRCARCGGRMIALPSVRSGLRFSCEHRRLCGASLPACPACEKDLPVRDPHEPDTSRCSCGASFPACPECADGWLVERKGKYGAFLGCVNYPRCSGKKKLEKGGQRRSTRRRNKVS